jgi:hypothetical protein
MATRKPKAVATQETGDMIVVQDATQSGKKIFKTHGEEFTLGTDFAAIAAALNLSNDQITWTIEDDQADGIDGKSLVGRAT